MNTSSNQKQIIIFSHGSGVRKDDRGLLSDIAQAMPEMESVLFDYYQVDEVNMIIYTCAISEQVMKLNQIIAETRAAHPGAAINLIGHSQGTIIAALAKPEGIKKTIFLAPVFDMAIERTLSRYASNPQADIHLDGVSKLPPLDGFVRMAPAQYWKERATLQPFQEYAALAKVTDLIIINANQENILPPVDLKDLSPEIKLMSIDGDHGFTGVARGPLIELIKSLLKDDKS